MLTTCKANPVKWFIIILLNLSCVWLFKIKDVSILDCFFEIEMLTELIHCLFIYLFFISDAQFVNISFNLKLIIRYLLFIVILLHWIQVSLSLKTLKSNLLLFLLPYRYFRFGMLHFCKFFYDCLWILFQLLVITIWDLYYNPWNLWQNLLL